jgi:diaminopimelate epimerase
MIDDRDRSFDLKRDTRALMCDRHFGIGADGLILLRDSQAGAYEMVYHNADGAIGSMCGNGARCTYAFARDLGIVDSRVRFIAYDGEHEGWNYGDDVSITMRTVEGIEWDGTAYILDTGSPHYVLFVDDLSTIDVVRQGREIRNSPRFAAEGINVNFVEVHTGYLRVSTYERGVENRTLACGTGVTAVALAFAVKAGLSSGPVNLHADGGRLKVEFDRDQDSFKSVVLTGPAERVYDGDWPVSHPSVL